MIKNYSPEKKNSIDEWNGDVTTIYYQGMNSSQLQCSKYTGRRGFTTTTNEHVIYRRNPIDVIKSPFIGKELDEINLLPFSSFLSYFNPMICLISMFTWVVNKYNFTGTWIQERPGPNGSYLNSLSYHSLNIRQMSIGQMRDVEEHNKKFELWKESHQEEDLLILYGVSRGAATTFNAFAKYKYEPVKLVILEGCFFDVQETLEKRYGNTTANFATSIFGMFTKYERNGLSPGKSVNDFPKNTPVVFVTSKLDKEVYLESTERLARALFESGNDQVYLLKLESSSHPNYMSDSEKDREKYEVFIHAIYKKYNLPCIPALAEKGEHYVDECLLKSNDIADKNNPTAKIKIS